MFLRHANDTRGLSVYEIAKNLAKVGIDVSVVAPNSDNYKASEVLDDIKINRFHYFFPKKFERLAYGSGMPVNLRNSWLAKIQLLPFVMIFIKKAFNCCKDADIIHSQWILPGFVGLLVGKILGKKTMVTIRQIAPSPLMRMINKFVLERTDHVIFNSSFTRDEILKFCNIKSYSVMNPTVNCEKFKRAPKNEIEKLREKLNMGKNAKVIFSMGLLVPKKGFDYLIRAMPKILEKEPSAFLIIGGEGAERLKLESLIKELGVQNSVNLVGQIDADKTPLYFSMSEMFVLPSIFDEKGETETFGVVLIEALACGKPVIASNVGGIVDIVNEKCGFLVEQKNSDALAEKIILLLNNEKLRNKLGIQARKYVSEVFSEKNMLENYPIIKNC